MLSDRGLLLRQWGHKLAVAAANGLVTGKTISKREIQNWRITTVAGPRAGAIEVWAGRYTGAIGKALAAEDGALLRQLIPFRFAGRPYVYWSIDDGRSLRLEAQWPDELAVKDVPMSRINRRPLGGGIAVIGIAEDGRTITLRFDETKPHALIAGTTGSGKTWAMRTVLTQLSLDPNNRLVLIDGKAGAGLGVMRRFPGVVGPLAADLDSARRALAWAYSEMRRRFEIIQNEGTNDSIHGLPRIFVAIDEVQNMAGKSGDPLLVEIIRRLVTEGREVFVHVIVGTQHPKVEVFGDAATKANLTIRMALKVIGAKASEIAVGGPTPRADYLSGHGDSYIVTPDKLPKRVLFAYYAPHELQRMNVSEPELSDWPEFSAEDLGRPLDPRQAPAPAFTPEELAVSLVNAHMGNGRPALVRALEAAGLGTPGSVRAGRLLETGRKMNDWLKANDWTLQSEV